MNDNFTKEQDRKLNYYLAKIRANKDKIDKQYLIKLSEWSKDTDSQEERTIREAVYWFTWLNFCKAFHLIENYICSNNHVFEYDTSYYEAFKIQGNPTSCPVCKEKWNNNFIKKEG